MSNLLNLQMPNGSIADSGKRHFVTKDDDCFNGSAGVLETMDESGVIICRFVPGITHEV